MIVIKCQMAKTTENIGPTQILIKKIVPGKKIYHNPEKKSLIDDISVNTQFYVKPCGENQENMSLIIYLKF